MFDYTHNDRTDGLGDLSEIVRLIKVLDWARETDRDQLVDSIEQRIQEMPLSVCVRDAWRPAGQLTDEQPEEFEILLGTGGPAVRIYGTLGRYGAPVDCQLQNQDWGTPWQSVRIQDPELNKSHHAALLKFCGHFYFAD